ncbi:hypothetical protein ABIC83_002462 [Roseateles asaccharophilus]|uniref:hypothetical protein n=1 Tax=Roseateles asaccharophilus TaxID=582607 RepID=UPI0038393D45
MRSSLEKTLTKEGWLPEPEVPVKPAFNRRVLTSAAEAREARRRAEAKAQEDEARRAAARAELLSEQGPRTVIQDQQQISATDWIKWSIISILGVAAVIPALVYVGRALQTTEVLTKEGLSGAVMTCKRGVTEAADDSTPWTWLVGGSRFRCTEWDTIEARKQRAADLTEEQYRARERAKRRSAGADTDLE